MKYIRNFESIKNEYYVEINMETYNSNSNRQIRKNFSANQILKIEEVVGINVKIKIIEQNLLLVYDDSKVIQISNSEDSWIYVCLISTKIGTKTKYYRCDQFDGLIDLLNDKLTKNINESANKKYYRKIDRFEFNKEVVSRKDFRKNEISQLNNLFNSYNNNNITTEYLSSDAINYYNTMEDRECRLIIGGNPDSRALTKNKKPMYVAFKETKVALYIFKSEADYFYMRIDIKKEGRLTTNTYFYECDDFEDLTDLLNNTRLSQLFM